MSEMATQLVCFRLLDHVTGVKRMTEGDLDRDINYAAQELLAADEVKRTLGALCWLSWPQMIARFSPRTRDLIMARVEHGRSLVGRNAP